MFAQVFVLSWRGERLLHKDFRGGGGACQEEEQEDGAPSRLSGPALEEAFFRGVAVLAPDQAPVFFAGGAGVHFTHVRHAGLFFAGALRPGASPFAAVEFLNRLAALTRDSCGSLEQKALALNAPLLHELLDEMMDYGYVQTMAPELLRNFVQMEPVLGQRFSLLDLSTVGLFGADTQQSKVAPSSAAARPSLSLRGEQGSRPEIFLDVVERLTVIIAANGTPMKADIQGEIRLKSFFPGCSEMRVGLTEEFCVGKMELRGYGMAIHVDECSFHSSVKLDEFERSRILRVNLSQGEVTLMQYQLANGSPMTLPFHLFPTVSHEPGSRVQVYLKLRCHLPPKSHAVNVRVHLPVPKAVLSLSQELSSPEQTATLQATTKSIEWVVPRIQGGSQLSALFKLEVPGLSRAGLLELGPINVSFEVPSYTSSGLQIRFLRFVGPQPSLLHRWVRYVTHSESYVIRLNAG
ncbi:AP-4 complex subunit mu-1 isoform X3 [Sceloporus undulatus]|uniref:AP-4 complex subunit mu-1 isoform X3 n=1 Tax=Sceloporus undulatus TaxID=8520 RepID=UPI001C4B8375|nr:AP-4 complex subunit mu-1 isoform X3 [Sceloporus undulatus]